TCSRPSACTMVVCVLVLVIVASLVMVMYLLPGCTFTRLGDGQAHDVTVLEYKPRQQIAVKFPEELKTGQQCVLIFDYSANLSHTYDGFYNSSYTDKDGNKRYISIVIFV
ncbi:hypothetical protein XENOCAPTIV_029137, partial [Xenoophorus captivus]